jgi:hypothetical protein
MSGKGDKRRPRKISDEEYESNWDRIFSVCEELDAATEELVADMKARGYTDEQIEAVVENRK